MLKRFKVKNYRNFKKGIEINLDTVAGYQFSSDCISNGVISKMLIYGRNATGKTNLGTALMDIQATLFGDFTLSDSALFLNADSQGDSAGFSYTFQFGESELEYRYSRISNQTMKEEELILCGTTIFRCDFSTHSYYFDNLNKIKAETAATDRYRQASENITIEADNTEATLPFLRWLISNVALSSDSILIRLANYVRSMQFLTVGNEFPTRFRKIGSIFSLPIDNSENLQDLENFLNAMGIDCRLALRELPDGHKKLYFAHDRLIPFFETASSGTLALVDLYRRFIFRAKKASLIYLDEFDAFYHYEMAENVIKYFKHQYPQCQVIMTSHNTNLMTNRLMRPDCLFILSRNGSLTSLCHATGRELREGHNLEKMYISGEFEKYE